MILADVIGPAIARMPGADIVEEFLRDMTGGAESRRRSTETDCPLMHGRSRQLPHHPRHACRHHRRCPHRAVAE